MGYLSDPTLQFVVLLLSQPKIDASRSSLLETKSNPVMIFMLAMSCSKNGVNPVRVCVMKPPAYSN